MNAMKESSVFSEEELREPKSLTWLSIDKQDKVKVGDAASEVLQNPRLLNAGPSQAENRKMECVSLITVMGKVRTGKSYLMNALSETQAFGVSGQGASFTKGAMLSDQLQPCSRFGVSDSDSPFLAFVDM